VPAAEERKLVTVLFADLVGSTVFAGERDPERVRGHAGDDRRAIRSPHALGVARHEDELLARADARFAELGLEWHRAQTERLLAGV
jgi:hypothetical protein